MTNRMVKGFLSQGRVSFLALFGVLDSFYLLQHHIAVNGGYQREPSSCNLGGILNCDAVALSPYAEILGIPLASYGLAYYILILCFISFFGGSDNEKYESSGEVSAAIYGLSFLSLPGTILYIYVSYFLVGFICLGCSLLYITNFALCFVAWKYYRNDNNILSGIFSGLCSFLRLILPWPGVRRYFYLTYASLLILVLFIPSALTQYVFEPRRRLLSSSEVIMPIYQRWQNLPQVEVSFQWSPEQLSGDYVLGDPDAQLTLIIFSDFECPACKKAAKTAHLLHEDYPKSFKVVFKHYPLDQSCNVNVKRPFHSLSCLAAKLSHCAGLQGNEYFWMVHDRLFDVSLLDWRYDALIEIPKKLEGLNYSLVQDCLVSNVVEQKIKADIAVGNQSGVTGTPALFLNGKRLEFDNDFSLQHLSGLIKMILARDYGVGEAE